MLARVTTIALDAMGGDNGAEAMVGGAALASLDEDAPEIVLVGDESIIKRVLESTEHRRTKLHIVHTTDAIPMDCEPREALDAMPESSLAITTRLTKTGDADALVSAGNTGAVILACARTFERLPGVKRCALGAVFPTELRRGEKNDPFSLILDAGLTVDVTADDLVGFAIMGAAYSSRISRNQEPRVALLSNGTEENKGTEAVVGAHRRLKAEAKGLGINFIGNIEGMDIPKGTADVVITGGFTGNIVLKMLEGVAATVRNLGRYAMGQSVVYKAGLALLSPALKQLKEVTDWEQYGGAPVLGFDHVCIKAHGRSSSRAVKNAIRVAKKAHQSGLVDAIKGGMAREHAPSVSSTTKAGMTSRPTNEP
jgi:glycerol-3-phosphate acyltransferase PlsX